MSSSDDELRLEAALLRYKAAEAQASALRSRVAQIGDRHRYSVSWEEALRKAEKDEDEAYDELERLKKILEH